MSQKLYSLTIFGAKKPGMDEEAYHEYVSKTHAGHLKALLAKHDIVSYTMQHNSPETRGIINQTHPGLPESSLSDCNTVIQIVFKDIANYLRVREEPDFKNIVGPDHVNFADAGKTRFVTGWFEVHVQDGKVVS